MIHYVYIDAENHYLRCSEAATRVLDRPDGIELLGFVHSSYAGGDPVPYGRKAKGSSYPVCNPRYHLYWEYGTVHRQMGYLMSRAADFRRALFVAPYTGDADGLSAMRTDLRDYGFDPLIIHEEKSHKRRRENLRGDASTPVLDKAKGCDIALATSMVADAAAGLYEACHLFTSDADFLPAVEAVRRMGKLVFVYGVESNLPKNSPYLYAPDRFIDLESEIRRIWEGLLPQHKREAEERLDAARKQIPG